MHSQQQIEFNNFLDTQLNEAQYKAVTHGNGPLLVIAGAGSGKTRVITARITHMMVNKHISGHAIIALTFTNKAAHEMRERIKYFIGTSLPLPFIGTFHSYCLLLLKKYAGFETFSILDTDDQTALIKNIVQRSNMQKQFSAKTILYTISQFKNNPTNNAQAYFSHPFIEECYTTYEAEKRASRCFDFDDLLIETLNLFKKDIAFKNRFQATVRHVLVDEYQDTNSVQHALLDQMTKKDTMLSIDSVCVVGDEDQSIYSWRGATITNMLNFSSDFKDTTFIKIEQNYRSVQHILEIANNVIQQNTQRTPKNLWSEKKGTNTACRLSCMSEYQESDAIAYAIKSTQPKKKLSSFAVLYRTHTQSRAIEESFIKQGIPYKIVGGIQFYERREIKDLLAYLKLCANPFDRISLLRILNTPNRGLGPKCEELIHEIWKEQPFLSYHNVIELICTRELLPTAKQLLLRKFIALFDGLSSEDKPSTVINTIIKRVEYIAYLKNSCEEKEADERIENIKELLSAVHHFESEELITTQLFLEEVALMQDKLKETSNAREVVTIMTLHAAKGLEFDTVFLTGLEENVIPTARSFQDAHGVEEERRLFYVGITRACHKLVLSYAKHRYTYGQMQKQIPSRFLDEVPAHLAPEIDCTYWDKSRCMQFFAQWFGTATSNTILTFGNAPIANHGSRKNVVPQEKIKPLFGAQSGAHTWYKNQIVNHQKYGSGIVKEVEKVDDQTIYVTIHFKTGTKKILSSFLNT